MMKYLPFLALCAVAFLPTQAESILWGSFLDRIRTFVTNNTYTNRRNERDCEALFTSAGITNTEPCYCDGAYSSLYLSCDTSNEEVCISSSDATYSEYCTNNTFYSVRSTDRPRLAFSVTPKIENEFSRLIFNDEGFKTILHFSFDRDLKSNNNVVDECFAKIVPADSDLDFPFTCDCHICGMTPSCTIVPTDR